MSVDVPESLESQIKAAAVKRRMSVEEFVATALLDKASSVLGDPRLDQRARCADGRGWEILNKVPADPPLAGDEVQN